MADNRYSDDRNHGFMLRMSQQIRERLAAEAKANGRSMNAEAVHRLASSFGADFAVETDEAQTVLQQIAADIRAMREMQERQQRPRVEVTPRTMLDMQARPSAQALRHTNGADETF